MKVRRIISMFLVYLICLNSVMFIYAGEGKAYKLSSKRYGGIEHSKNYDSEDVVFEDGFVFDISTGTIVDYTGSASSIVIPSEIMGVRVDIIGMDAFSESRNIVSVEIPEGVTNIDTWAFGSCSNLTSVSIPESIERIGDGAFSYCSSLTDLTIPKNVTFIGESAFGDCISLENISVDSENQYYCDDNGVLLNKEKTELIQFPTGKNINSYSVPMGVKYINSWAFADCSNLESVIIPSSVISIKSEAFAYMDNLTNVEILDGLKYIEEWAFEGCVNLENITIPNSVTDIGEYAFFYCGLTEIEIPDSIREIKQGVFKNCENLKTVLMPDSIIRIGKSAFYDCKKLENIKLPAYITSIEYAAFKNCISLKSIEIPENIADIKGYSFDGCLNLQEVKILNKDISIEKSSFFNCNNIKDVYCYKNSQADSEIIFSNSNIEFHYLDDEDITKKTAKFIVSNEECKAGELVDIYVNIKENPGVAVYNLKVKFDRNKLTPVSISQGINGGDKITSNLNEPNVIPETLTYVTALWNNFSNMNYNGYLFRLRFKAKENVVFETVPITLECTEKGILDENYEEITPQIQNGSVTIKTDYDFGDINMDKNINGIDLLMLNQFIAEYNNISFNDAQKYLADVYRDTIINIADLVLFKQYLAGWDVVLGKSLEDSLSVFENKSIDLSLKNTYISDDEIKISAVLKNNTGVSGFKFKLNYDSSVLEPVAIEKGDIIEDSDIMSNIDSNNKEYVTAVWTNTTNINNDGVIFNVVFKIKDKEKETADFSLTFDDGNIINQSFEKISANNVDKKVYLTQTDENFIYGDVDGDKYVTANDAALVLQYVLNSNSVEFNDTQKRAALVSDENSSITTNDVTCILNKSLNESYIFPVLK